MPRRLAIVASHVIQYQDPFFRLLAAEPEIDLTVLYLSPAGATPYRDKDMQTTLRWDLDLLHGYDYRFIRNLARDPNREYFRHVNPGLVPALLRGHFDAVLFMLGWGSLSALLGIATCRLARIPILLFGDSAYPPQEHTLRNSIRTGFLRALFGVTTGFMTSGVLNADYYRHYGADARRFFMMPWAIDNDRFERGSRFAPGERDALREQFGIGRNDVAFLFSAKLIPRKDPMTLLRALEAMRRRDRAVVVFMGDGELRGELESFAREHHLDRVRFLGFINQSDIPKHYAMCDVFVLPSLYEPRGTVVNEAMACGLPAIVSDRYGAIGDIIRENDNAFIYPAGDAGALATAMDRLAGDDALRASMSARSREIISTWDYAHGVEGVKAALQWIADGARV
jgi:glycosyltransferase involved in cell wall biosynthesis